MSVANTVHRLKAIEVERLAKRRGMHHDGAGLYLFSDGKAQCSWLFRYMLNRRAHAMGLGPYPEVTLARAREKVAKARRLIKAEGRDPIEEREAELARARLEAAKAMSFKQCAEEYIASHKAGWRHEKHGKLWTNTLATYAYPAMGETPVAEVDTALVMNVLKPIWTTKPETAARVRQRMESILDYAKVYGYRLGENPARWRGHLKHLLPEPSTVRAVKNFAALPYKEQPAFMTALREEGGVSARALEFTILTAARTGEAIGARWPEINLTDKLWTIPGARMKAKKEHRVPLSDRAVAVLKALSNLRVDKDGFIFAAMKPGKPISNMAMLKLLERMGRDEITVHGFRSTFRDWAAEQTNFPNHVMEMALAHSITEKVEAAYRRGDLFDKRRELMDAWAEYCASKPEKPTQARAAMREAEAVS